MRILPKTAGSVDKKYTQSLQLIVLAVIYAVVMYLLIFCSIIKMGAIYQ